MDAERFTTDTFQLRRVQFVPAQRQDTAPVPKGVDIIVLNGTLPVRPLLNSRKASTFSLVHFSTYLGRPATGARHCCSSTFTNCI